MGQASDIQIDESHIIGRCLFEGHDQRPWKGV